VSGLEELVRRNTRRNRDRPLRRKVARDGKPKVGADGLHCHGCGKDNASADYVEHRDLPGTFHVVWWCNTCGPAFRLRDAATAIEMDWRDVQSGNEGLLAKYAEEPERPTIDPAQIEEWHDRLWFDVNRMRFLNVKRLVSCEVIRRRKYGHDGERFVIPVWDDDGVPVNLRRYHPNPPPGEPKILSLLNAGTQLYGTFDRLHLVNTEGELDCDAVESLGIPAFTTTGGTYCWRDEWAPRFAGRAVLIVPDRDRAGIVGAERRAASLSAAGAEVITVELPMPFRETKGLDATDFLRTKRGPERFRRLLNDAWRQHEVEKRRRDRPQPVPSPSSRTATKLLKVGR